MKIINQIHAFFRDELLAGQDDGLTAKTPLLELGILDSFGLLKLISHLEDLYRIEISHDELVGRNFRDMEAIANLVTRRLDAAPNPAKSRGREAQLPGIAVLEVPECAQVMIVFRGLRFPQRTALGDNVSTQEPLEDPRTLLAWAGLQARNIVALNDVSGHNYREGISSALPTQVEVFEWLRNWIDQRPHLEEVYCIGVSAGGPMAMLAGEYLCAKTVWAFAPRTAQDRLFVNREDDHVDFVYRATGKTLEQLEADMTPQDAAKIGAYFTPTMVEDYYRDLPDPDRYLDYERLGALADSLSPGNGITEHRVYYVAAELADALVAERLEGKPNVTLIPVEPSNAPPPRWALSPWIHPMKWLARNHTVMTLLRERGNFANLFPEYRAAAVGEAYAIGVASPSHEA